MDIQEQHERGLALRTEMFGREAVETRMNAFGEFGKPLQHVINAYAYGDVWQTLGAAACDQVVAMVAMMAAAGHTNELRVHLKGALKNGCSVEQIQEILLLVTLYCGIPAANEAHRVAADVLREEKLYLIHVHVRATPPRLGRARLRRRMRTKNGGRHDEKFSGSSSIAAAWCWPAPRSSAPQRCPTSQRRE